jgi:hypothetical protein
MPGVGADHPEGDAHRRRLAGAIGAEEAEDLATGDLEVEPIERDDGPEALADVVDVEGHLGWAARRRPGTETFGIETSIGRTAGTGDGTTGGTPLPRRSGGSRNGLRIDAPRHPSTCCNRRVAARG